MKCRAGGIHCIEMYPARPFCALTGTGFEVGKGVIGDSQQTAKGC